MESEMSALQRSAAASSVSRELQGSRPGSGSVGCRKRRSESEEGKLGVSRRLLS